jgi:hypothetical protein
LDTSTKAQYKPRGLASIEWLFLFLRHLLLKIIIIVFKYGDPAMIAQGNLTFPL